MLDSPQYWPLATQGVHFLAVNSKWKKQFKLWTRNLHRVWKPHKRRLRVVRLSCCAYVQNMCFRHKRSTTWVPYLIICACGVFTFVDIFLAARFVDLQFFSQRTHTYKVNGICVSVCKCEHTCKKNCSFLLLREKSTQVWKHHYVVKMHKWILSVFYEVRINRSGVYSCMFCSTLARRFWNARKPLLYRMRSLISEVSHSKHIKTRFWGLSEFSVSQC